MLELSGRVPGNGVLPRLSDLHDGIGNVWSDDIDGVVRCCIHIFSLDEANLKSSSLRSMSLSSASSSSFLS